MDFLLLPVEKCVDSARGRVCEYERRRAKAICLFDNFAAVRPPPIELPGNCGYTRRMVNHDTSTFIFLTACLFGGVLIAAFTFHLYLYWRLAPSVTRPKKKKAPSASS